MKLPGFTAENALGKPSRVYWSYPVAFAGAGNRFGIVPAQAAADEAEGGETGEEEAEQHDDGTEVHNDLAIEDAVIHMDEADEGQIDDTGESSDGGQVDGTAA
jgi:hypothetical protein